MSYINVRIIRIGLPVVEVSIQTGQTVQDALTAAEITSTGAAFLFNGVSVSNTATLTENGDLLITKQIAGA